MRPFSDKMRYWFVESSSAKICEAAMGINFHTGITGKRSVRVWRFNVHIDTTIKTCRSRYQGGKFPLSFAENIGYSLSRWGKELVDVEIFGLHFSACVKKIQFRISAAKLNNYIASIFTLL